jgi:alkylation response protein AidB-like acyl-CoA dehydrogenase
MAVGIDYPPGMAFFQTAPGLGNQWDDDPLVREYLERVVPAELLGPGQDELRHLGELSGGELYLAQLADRLNEPELTAWDAWGQRVDRIILTPLWQRAQRLAAEHGLVATAYEASYGGHGRTLQMAKNYLIQGSLDQYSCPLAMTDGAASTLREHAEPALRERALAHLLSRDPSTMWTSGQWMTERTGGSDVGLAETVARPQPDGSWTLHGTKWFTSATTAEMALTLGRPAGGAAGGKGLALFYVETRDAQGGLTPGLAVNRLKDKLGTRKVPTAELSLDGVRALAVRGDRDGIRNIVPMLNVTRLWNAVGSALAMRRGVALALDYAGKRRQFGALLRDKPLHADTLAGLVAEQHGAFLLAFLVGELRGKIDAGLGSDDDKLLCRVATPLAKLTTGKQAVAVTSECLEAFGGAGYIEDTGLPALLRDAQVLPIWEGTTNVLALDTLRALAQEGAHAALARAITSRLDAATPGELGPAVATARAALGQVVTWTTAHAARPAELEAGARGLALTLGRTLELALLCEHAAWCLSHGKGPRAAAAARRFAQEGVDRLNPARADDAAWLTKG